MKEGAISLIITFGLLSFLFFGPGPGREEVVNKYYVTTSPHGPVVINGTQPETKEVRKCTYKGPKRRRVCETVTVESK